MQQHLSAALGGVKNEMQAMGREHYSWVMCVNVCLLGQGWKGVSKTQCTVPGLTVSISKNVEEWVMNQSTTYKKTSQLFTLYFDEM